MFVAIPAIGADTYFGIVAPSAIQVFGIFLMRRLMDEVAYSDRGARVQLVKRAPGLVPSARA